MANLSITLISHVKVNQGSCAWLGLVDPTTPELALLAELATLEPLDVEDASNVAQRAKFNGTQGEGFALLATLVYNDGAREVIPEHIRRVYDTVQSTDNALTRTRTCARFPSGLLLQRYQHKPLVFTA